MTEKICRNCRYWLSDDVAEGDCMNLNGPMKLTKAADTCGHFHAAGVSRMVGLSLALEPSKGD